jgi:glucuronoarabinoxylan endo-1,4-beta-xylanase
MKNKQLNHFSNKKHLSVFASFCLILIMFFSQSYTQTLSVRGKVTASRYAVQSASVTFIDEADTTIRFSALTDASGNYQIGVITSIGINPNNVPGKFELAQNFPNPFSSITEIPYSLNKLSDVQITIYDILGREIKKFVVGKQNSGSYNILWDGRNSVGKRVANGIYFCRLQTEDESQVRKMILTSGGESSISVSRNPSSQMLKAVGQSVQGENYTVRIENTDDTYPLIIPKQFDKVPVKNDTTINFNLTYITSATVNLDIVHQCIRGFGAANILLWRPDMTDSEIQTAFGTGDGQLGFSILRLMLEADKSRWCKYVPTAKKAYDMGVTIIAAPWYAPAEMVETVNGVSRVCHNMYDQYAAHLDSFNTYMANNDVPIYGISVQNEPDITDQWTSWTADEMLTFMRDYAHAINGTKVMAPESFQFRCLMADPILNDPVACANTDIVCGHIYGAGLCPYPLAEEKGKEIWMTEHLSGENSNANNWDWAFAVAKEINDVMQADMSAYVWWYIVRYYGPISDGTMDCGRKGEVTKKGYVMSQYSRFIRPGYYRVECNTLPWSCNVYVTAYKDSTSSKAVIVAVNNNSAPRDLAIRLPNGSMNQFTTYVTTQSKNCVKGDDVNIINNSFIFNLEASSVTTFVSQ